MGGLIFAFIFVMMQKLLSVLDELEALKPEFQRQVGRAQGAAQPYELDGQERRPYGSPSSSIQQHAANNRASISNNDQRVFFLITMYILRIFYFSWAVIYLALCWFDSIL